MNLAFHQLRLEFRRGLPTLVLYGLVLFCNFAVAMGWVGEPRLLPHGHWAGGSLLPVLFMIGFWVAFTKVVAGCVLADSPARRDKFLATRPLPSRTLFAAKVWYILLAAVLPAALAEAGSLLAVDVPLELVLRAGTERFLITLSAALVIAAFSANWAHGQSMVLAATISFGATLLLGNLLLAVSRSLGPIDLAPLENPSLLATLQSALVLALGLSVTSWIKARRGLKLPWLSLAFAVSLAASLVTEAVSPFRTAPFRGTSQSELNQVDPTESIELAGPWLSASAPWQDSADLNFTCSVLPLTTGLPDDWELRWRSVDTTWTSQDRLLQRDSADPHVLASQHVTRDGVSVSWPLAEAIQDFLGAEVMFMAESSHAQVSSSLTAGSLRYEPGLPPSNQNTRLQSTIAADAFRWRIVADLPLNPGTSSENWTIAGMDPAGPHLRLHLLENHLALHTAPAPRDRTGNGWRSNNQFALYLPSRNLAWLGQIRYGQASESLFAIKSSRGTIEFTEDHTANSAWSDPDILTDARLLVLQADYLGRLVTEWTSDEMSLPDRPWNRGSQPNPFPNDQQFSPAEFSRWFHQWEKRHPDDDDTLLRPHLTELLTQVARCNRSLMSPQEPAVIYAARFVPEHLDFLIEKMPGLSLDSVRFLTAVITQGAGDSQRDRILEACPYHAPLVEVAEARGWLAESPETILTLLRQEGLYRAQLFGTLLAIDNPQFDSVLLEQYQRHPSAHRYEMLRQVPRLASEADNLLNSLWKPGRIVLNHYGQPPGLQVAMRQGRQEALEQVFELLEHHGSQHSQVWNLAQLLTANLQLPEELMKVQHDHRKVLEWATRHRASDFAWDPVLRLFVLKRPNDTI